MLSIDLFPFDVRAVTHAADIGDTMPVPRSGAESSMTMSSKRARRPPSVPSNRRAGALVFAVLMAVMAAVAAADAHAGKASRRPLLAQSPPAVSADQAAATVRAASGGRILDVRLDSRSQPPIYRVKVLLEGGRVRVYRVDASNGRILE